MSDRDLWEPTGDEARNLIGALRHELATARVERDRLLAVLLAAREGLLQCRDHAAATGYQPWCDLEDLLAVVDAATGGIGRGEGR